MKKDDVLVDEKFNKLVEYSSRSGKIDVRLYADYDVKRGLRDSGGKGVLTGLTEISDVVSFGYIDGERVPIDGELYFQGVNVEDLIRGEANRRLPSRRQPICYCSESCPPDSSFMNSLI